MTTGYAANELLEIAQQMERNGYAFYDRAAAQTKGTAAGMLRELAQMERAHERTFAAMAAEVAADKRQAPVFDPDGEAVRYVRAVVDGRVFDLKADPAAWLTGSRTLPEIIRKAIGLENDTIVYYLGLRDVMAGLARERMDNVLHEEMNHVVVLTEQLKQAQAR